MGLGMLGLDRKIKGKTKRSSFSLQSDTLGFVSLGSMAAEKALDSKRLLGIEESARMRMRDKGRLSDETPSEEGQEIIRFRRGWESLYSHRHRSFDATTFAPMRYTHYADCNYGLQIFSVKVNQLLLNEEEEEGLHWPLHVYGLIATRDSLDPRRNLLFNRTRDNCQILTQQDPFLLLTGPTRAVVLIDPVKFEIQLKAKGRSESEDKVLNFRVLVYHHDYSLADPPFIVRRRRRCKRSELEFALALLVRSVEATISVQVVDGSWPDDLGGQVVARMASISDAIKLLDSRSADGGRVPICPDDGVVKLSRRVVSVELAGGLEVDIRSVSHLKGLQPAVGYVHVAGSYLFKWSGAWTVVCLAVVGFVACTSCRIGFLSPVGYRVVDHWRPPPAKTIVPVGRLDPTVATQPREPQQRRDGCKAVGPTTTFLQTLDEELMLEVDAVLFSFTAEPCLLPTHRLGRGDFRSDPIRGGSSTTHPHGLRQISSKKKCFRPRGGFPEKDRSIDRISLWITINCCMATRRGDRRKKSSSSDGGERMMRDLLMMQRLEVEEEEEESQAEEDYEIVMFRRVWTRWHGRNFGSFDDTTYPAMRYTFGRIPKSSFAGCDNGLQIFSIKLLLRNTSTTDHQLQWPLHVYGLVATRDSLDPRRNLLFNRIRDNCQILTQQDPFLVLTGPSRAIVLIDPVQFEVQLKAKSNNNTLHDHPDQDQIVNFGVVDSGYLPGPTSHCIGKRSEGEFAISVFDRSIEATIISVQLVGGSSWPDHLQGRLVSRTASTIHQEIVLLDSQKQQDGKMPIDDGGFIQLSRRVVSVELAGQLIVQQVVDNDNDSKKDEIVAKHEIVFDPKEASLSVETCELQLGGGGGGPCKLQISVAWSLVDRLRHK
uniref:DUF6598 domain-containing protein n=1 Tax=Oryza meridionalis TaxID=40149 RepID=A0A0E0F1C8_9ORYZ